MDRRGGKGVVLTLRVGIVIALALTAIFAIATLARPSEAPIMLTSSQRAELKAFIVSEKFHADDEYVGFLSKDVVADPDLPLNQLATRTLTKGNYTKDAFLDDAIGTLKAFELADTEDREHAFGCVERLMKILGIESSEGRLNEAFYGFDPGGISNQ